MRPARVIPPPIALPKTSALSRSAAETRGERYMNSVANTLRLDSAARALKRGVLGSLSATPLVAAILAAGANSAYAQAQTAQAQAAQAPAVEEIIVTGTRVVRDGFQAPTPVSVVGVEQMQQGATPNIADYIN